MEPGNGLDAVVTLLAVIGVLVAIPVTFVVMVLVRRKSPHGRPIPVWKRLKSWAGTMLEFLLTL